MLRVFSGLLTLTWRGKAGLSRARRLWCRRARDESTFEELYMLRGPAQWGNVEAITTMPTEKVIQGE
jgi:hypothetical protein